MSSSRIHMRPGFRFAAAVALATGAVLGFAAPAVAHDQLLSSDPANGAVLAAPPDRLTLTFSGVVQGDLGGTEVQVTDASGTAVTEGEPVITDNLVTQSLTPAASGPVHVAWRVVSEDGHPIAGEFDFTVAAPATPTAAPTSSTSSATPPATEPSATPVPPASSDETANASPAPWIVLGVVVLLAAGGVAWLLVVRSRRKDGPTAGSPGPSGPPAGR